MTSQNYAARGAQPEEQASGTTTTRLYRDSKVDVKIVLCALWIAMLFVFAYVDIFGFLRADILNAALDGKVATTGFTIDQTFLTFTLVYVLVPALMVVLSLLLQPRVNRVVNIVASVVYTITIIGSAIGETWVYYFVGSIVEVILLVAIVRTAWKWPAPQIARPGAGPKSHGDPPAQG